MQNIFTTLLLIAGVLCLSNPALGQVKPQGKLVSVNFLIDSTGAHWRFGDGQLVKKRPADDVEESLLANFANDGIQITNNKRKFLMPVEGRSTGFYGDSNDPNTVFQLIRHYDGKVSLMAQDGKTLFVDSDQTIRREKMDKIPKNAMFTLYSAANNLGQRSSYDTFDCSPSRIKQIRKRYGKVANNKKLKSKWFPARASTSITNRPTTAFTKELSPKSTFAVVSPAQSSIGTPIFGRATVLILSTMWSIPTVLESKPRFAVILRGREPSAVVFIEKSKTAIPRVHSFNGHVRAQVWSEGRTNLGMTCVRCSRLLSHDPLRHQLANKR